MNRNPPIMRLRLHWLRYDLVDPPHVTPTAPRLAPSLVSSISYTCAPAYICTRVNVTYTLWAHLRYTCKASELETVDARQIIFPMCTRRCRSPTACSTPARLDDFSRTKECNARVDRHTHLLENSAFQIFFHFFFLRQH